MKLRLIILLSVLSTVFFSCNSEINKLKNDNNLKENIIGDWEIIVENDRSSEDFSLLSLYTYPQGITISKDSIEFYSGIFKIGRDELTGMKDRVYLGNFVTYKIDKDSIIINNPITERWEFKWRFINRINDTLLFAINDTTFVRYKRLVYTIDTLPNFDQILFSSSGCYGSCPIIDVFITKEGSVLFQGEGYVNKLGFYSGNVNVNFKNYIFDKFRKANPLQLKDNYSVNHSDDQSLTTTFIRNGKIVKTIHDYGMSASKELIWAYVPISNIHTSIILDSIPIDNPYYPKFHYFIFEIGDLTLPLEKSESFYLWTELKKSTQTQENFKPKYNISFQGNNTYWGSDPNGSKQEKYVIKSITTDGQFYKFEYKNQQSITFDLGYNFIDRNFSKADFRKPIDRIE